MPRILLTTTSFQDTPGPHHELLEAQGWDIVRARGPLTEAQVLAQVGEVDGLLCGDDALTRPVLEKARPRLRVISKYGIGVDKIDVAAATALGLPVGFTPGVNHTTVAEHAFCLLLALEKNLVPEVDATRAGQWKRLIQHELLGKTLGIVGLGRIGKEVALRARAFGMRVQSCDVHWDASFAQAQDICRCGGPEDLLRTSDYVTLHTYLSPETHHLINRERLALMKRGALLINTARGELVDTAAVVEALDSGQLGGYGTDVLEVEPPPPDHPLLRHPRCLVTPHIGSRTYESVVRQANMALENLILGLAGQPMKAVVNPEAVKARS